MAVFVREDRYQEVHDSLVADFAQYRSSGGRIGSGLVNRKSMGSTPAELS
jgi:hypothetical protein